MEQTPVHDNHNPDLLALLPTDAQRLIEVGCSSGALAREYKKINPSCHYVGVEIDKNYGKLAKRYCNQVIIQDMDVASDALFKSYANRDVWIFGDTLEHFKDPWNVLTRIRKIIPNHGCIVTCIPNAQHWSIQARLNCGDFRYESSGLLDQTHLRWFTRQTMLELFESTGYRVIEGVSRFVDVSHPNLDSILSAIRAMAEATGTDPEIVVSDAIPFQYVLKAVPI